MVERRALAYATCQATGWSLWTGSRSSGGRCCRTTARARKLVGEAADAGEARARIDELDPGREIEMSRRQAQRFRARTTL